MSETSSIISGNIARARGLRVNKSRVVATWQAVSSPLPSTLMSWDMAPWVRGYEGTTRTVDYLAMENAVIVKLCQDFLTA